MAYNKKVHLKTNIEAIRIAFALDREKRRATEAEREVLWQYSGFGGIKCILNPAEKESDKGYWTKTDLELFPMVADLHRHIRENSKDEQEAKRYFNSLKSSVLTAFYTPPEAIKALSEALKENGITPVRFLEPSAGNGAFVETFKDSFPEVKTTAFEKDLLTGKVLSHLHPDDRVHVRGFEEIENRPDNRFDVVASNIPFGDTAVFDISFSKSNDPTKRQATQKVHNYFFLKGVETLREGGILAFITSQGVMNSPQNEPVRQWLMNNTNLVSAIRLPNNLMSDNAGTEVGSDLVILQKNSNKTSLTAEEQAFIKTRTLSNGININNYFQDFSRVVHTKSSIDKDLYGKPGLVFIHEGGVQGMAADLKRMLSGDFSKNLNKELYVNHAITTPKGLNLPEYHPTEQDWQEIGMMVDEAGREAREDLRQPENPKELTPEDMEEIDAALEAVRKRKWDEFVAARPYMTGSAQKPEEKPQTQPEAKPQPAEPAPAANQQPVMSLYDLFGFSEEERKQLNTQKRGKKKPAPKQGQPVQLNLFSQSQTVKPIPAVKPPETSQPGEKLKDHYKSIKSKHADTLLLMREGDNYKAFGEDAKRIAQILGTTLARVNGTDETGFLHYALDTNLPRLVRAGQRVAITDELETPKIENRQETIDMTKPRPWSGILQEHHKQGSLVMEQNGQIGFLQERYRDDAIFKSLELNPLQEKKAKLYIEIRDTYHSLYNYEAKEQKENPDLRQSLNLHYDTFVKRYGNLNDRKNLDLIKMDAGGREMLSIEHSENGKLVKADIFSQPVAFNPNEIKQADTSIEALSASLNKFGEVNAEYMLSLLPDKSTEEIIEELHGRIYYNPLIHNYETSDRFIAGNVIEKAEALEQYLKDNPQDEHNPETSESLKALKEATPRPITFEELDFNFGERWIPSGVYSRYAEYLFDVKTGVNYAPNSDEYSVKANYRTIAISDKYAVQGEFRKYDGVALMKHALHNTTPNISKSAKATDKDGKEITVKVRDGEKIQLANSKIDEIRSGFTDWLNTQTPEFKQRLTDLYNRKFNCFVRPAYDGSHQTFPNLDLKALGIPDLYQSQKDAIWMLKQNGGGICDHEVGAGKTLIMCCGAMEMKRLGLANKPLIIGLKANVHEIAATFKTAYPNAKYSIRARKILHPKSVKNYSTT